MRRLVSIDGEIAAPDAAKVSVYDRGFLYGDAVFETLRTYRGKPHALAEHLARLGRSAALLKMPPVDERAVAEKVRAALTAAREHDEDDGYARIILTRGSAPLGLDMSLAKEPRLVILVEPLAPPLPYDAGIRAVTVATLRAADGTTAAGAKVTSYLAAILALAEAKARGAQEAILLDAKGRVIEGTTSNVFAVKGTTIRTPPEDVGLLVGITRGIVLSVAEVEVAELTPSDLYDADEVFITSSLREVIGVVDVDGRAIGLGKVGDTTRRIHAAFRSKIDKEY